MLDLLSVYHLCLDIILLACAFAIKSFLQIFAVSAVASEAARACEWGLGVYLAWTSMSFMFYGLNRVRDRLLELPGGT